MASLRPPNPSNIRIRAQGPVYQTPVARTGPRVPTIRSDVYLGLPMSTKGAQ